MLQSWLQNVPSKHSLTGFVVHVACYSLHLPSSVVDSFESIVNSYALQENSIELVVERKSMAFVVERV